MSRKANPTIIGAFVVGALVIAVLAVILLTSGALFQKKLDFVMHFQGSVKGLNVGAPVSYRGVQIGTVKKIEIVLSPDQDARIPVTVEIDPTAFTFKGFEEKLHLGKFRESIHSAVVNDGLRAQLQMQSLLTGQLFIQLDYFPKTPTHLVKHEDMDEIPTVPTTLQELGSMLQGFPVEKVLGDIEKAAASLAELAGSDKLHATIDSVDQAFKDVSRLMNALDDRTEALGPALVEAKEALGEGRAALAQTSTALAAAHKTFVQATETLRPVKSLVGDDSELLESVEQALVAMTEAAEAIRSLADTLDRYPEAILRGKGAFGGH
jgi:paraquat-inducible protein B